MKTRTAFTAAVAAVGVTAASFSGIGANQPVATETSTQNPANAFCNTDHKPSNMAPCDPTGTHKGRM